MINKICARCNHKNIFVIGEDRSHCQNCGNSLMPNEIEEIRGWGAGRSKCFNGFIYFILIIAALTILFVIVFSIVDDINGNKVCKEKNGIYDIDSGKCFSTKLERCKYYYDKGVVSYISWACDGINMGEVRQ